MKFHASAATLVLGFSIAPAMARDVKFSLENNSYYQIDEFYASPANEDLKTVEEDCTEHELEGLNICESPNVEFTK